MKNKKEFSENVFFFLLWLTPGSLLPLVKPELLQQEPCKSPVNQSNHSVDAKEYFDHNPICLNNWEPPLLTIIITLYWKVEKPSKHFTCNAMCHSLWLLGFSVVFHFAFYNFSDPFHLIRIVIFLLRSWYQRNFFCRWINLISEGIKTWKNVW